ncbi:MAG: hypothetical protein PHP96_00765 [Candidatus Dojkabacteria bacterium]|jgi:uncharacterized membrane protein|nr:hypothetical protein [Candidatus Dojkabacteria bacterium]MDD4560921.1 hypothetical protein [Candidatus Dojkabacteria bacterium]NLB12125.1 hypothetical protein [Candidatus Dojkabacteria bacterium]
MDIIKKYLFLLVFLLIVVIAWVASLVYFENSEISINPNASSYTSQLNPNFDLEELEKVVERTGRTFPVSPLDFFNLVEEN